MRYFLIVIFLFFVNLSFSQKNFIPSVELKSSDGLPSAILRGGFQSSTNFIWGFGHHGGLFRYDGNIKIYTKEEHNLSSDFLNSVVEAPDSLLWVMGGMTGELILDISIFNPATEQVVSIKDFFKKPLPFPIEEVIVKKNYDGTLWIMNTKNDGNIYEYDGKKLSYWGNIPSQIRTQLPNIGDPDQTFLTKLDSSAFITIISKEETNSLYYVNKLGNVQQQIKLPSRLTNYQRSSDFSFSKNKEIFLTFNSKKLAARFLIKVDSNQKVHILDSIPSQRYNNYQYHQNHIFRSLNKKLTIYDWEMNLLYEFSLLKPFDIIFFDQQDGIWISQERGHLARIQIQNNPFKIYQGQLLDSLCLPATRGIQKTNQGDLFVTQGQHLLQCTSGGKMYLHKTPSYPYQDLKGIMIQEEKERIWLGDELGIWKLNLNDLAKSGVFYKGTKDQKLDRVWTFHADKKGKIWLGSTNGLHVINEKQNKLDPFLKHNGYDILSKSSVFAFHENDAGIWVLSSQGIFLLDTEDGILAHYHTNAKGEFHLPHNIIAHLYEDKEGAFWLASKGGGLIHWHPKKGTIDQFTTKNGLSDNVLYAIYPDDYNQLWLPSNHGLMRFDRSSKEALHYLVEDGLPSLEFNTISHFKAKDDTLYFGGLQGCIGFHPKDFIPQKSDYPLLITGFQKRGYDDKIQIENYAKINQDKIIILHPKDKSFELTFALLDFKNIKDNLYAYKIEGYDQNWQYTQNSIIKLNTLPYGTYQLYIKAQASGKAWQKLEAPITIRVLLPFYLQSWFLFILVLSSMLSIFLLFRWRISSLEKRKKELELTIKERTEEVVQQAEELKVLDKIKSRFFANISHELRTPLTLILGPVSVLEEQKFEHLDKKDFKKNTHLIKQNSKKLLTLIEEILELSKLEEGNVQLQEKPAHFHSYIRRIFTAFEPLAQIQNINYILEYQVDKELTLLIDVTKMEKIINNLLNNAFKFTPAKGKIQLSVTETANQISLTLSDDGKGILADDLPHIFERFYQSKSLDLKAQGGTGIGLALCREFANLMGGSISVKSQINEGSSFFFRFPKKITESSETTFHSNLEANSSIPFITKQEDSFTPKDKTLLLVEDNLDMQRFIISLLDNSYTIITAKNGLEGLEQLKLHTPNIDLIISDVMMPFMDGFTMLEKIKTNENWRSLPIILLTARASETDKLNALTIGVDDYLIKPFSSQELKARINNLIKNYEARQFWKPELLITANQKKQALLKEESPKSEKEIPQISSTELKWIKEVEQLTKTHLDKEDFDVTFLAKHLFLSKRQVDRKVTKITGLTSAKFIREVRLQTAREYLENHAFDSVAEVGRAIGIQTTSYFAKNYKQRFGKAPKSYFE